MKHSGGYTSHKCAGGEEFRHENNNHTFNDDKENKNVKTVKYIMEMRTVDFILPSKKLFPSQ
jgi:hypothetical protein